METVDREARTWAFVAHLLGFLLFFFPLIGNVVGPLVVLLVKGEQYEFVRDQAKEALNFQISMDIYLIVSALLWLVIIGFVLTAALLVFSIIVMIVAAVRSNEGEANRYPLCIRFVR